MTKAVIANSFQKVRRRASSGSGIPGARVGSREARSDARAGGVVKTVMCASQNSPDGIHYPHRVLNSHPHNITLPDQSTVKTRIQGQCAMPL